MGFCDPTGPPKHPLSYVLLLEMCLKAQIPPIKQMSETPPICRPETFCPTEGLLTNQDCWRILTLHSNHLD